MNRYKKLAIALGIGGCLMGGITLGKDYLVSIVYKDVNDAKNETINWTALGVGLDQINVFNNERRLRFSSDLPLGEVEELFYAQDKNIVDLDVTEQKEFEYTGPAGEIQNIGGIDFYPLE